MRRIAIGSVIAVAVLFLCLALPGSPMRTWLLNSLSDAPESRTESKPVTPIHTHDAPLRIAIGAMISPERTLDHYGRFFEAFAHSLNRTASIIQRRTYREVNELLLNSEIDLAWLCTGAWLELNGKHAARLLAVPVVEGKSTYNALIIANSRVKARSLLDLRGLRFAYTDPISLTGCSYPQGILRAAGHDPATFFSSTTFTHGHDTSIEAVRRGFADAASVDSLVYEYLEKLSPEEVRGLQILLRSEPFPIPPLAVPASLPEGEFLALQEALIRFSTSPEGSEALGPILVERFAAPDTQSYRKLE